MHQIGEDKGRIREIGLLKEVHDSEKEKKGKKKTGRKKESEALTPTRERKMNRCEDEQKEGGYEDDRKLEKREREREREKEREGEKAGVRFMESTYPEIYMNPWQEMRQMQRREEGEMAGRELPG